MSGIDSNIAREAINSFGLDLYRLQATGEDNLLISPYSIATALAMAYAGADGETRAEMQRVLHFTNDDAALHGSFMTLGFELAPSGDPLGDRTEIKVANRLFV